MFPLGSRTLEILFRTPRLKYGQHLAPNKNKSEIENNLRTQPGTMGWLGRDVRCGSILLQKSVEGFGEP